MLVSLALSLLLSPGPDPSSDTLVSRSGEWSLVADAGSRELVLLRGTAFVDRADADCEISALLLHRDEAYVGCSSGVVWVYALSVDDGRMQLTATGSQPGRGRVSGFRVHEGRVQTARPPGSAPAPRVEEPEPRDPVPAPLAPPDPRMGLGVTLVVVGGLTLSTGLFFLMVGEPEVGSLASLAGAGGVGGGGYMIHRAVQRRRNFSNSSARLLPFVSPAKDRPIGFGVRVDF